MELWRGSAAKPKSAGTPLLDPQFKGVPGFVMMWSAMAFR